MLPTRWQPSPPSAYAPTRVTSSQEPEISAMYWNGNPIDATEEYHTALVGYPLARIQLMAPSGSYPRSSRSNTRSVSIGGLVNVTPSNDRSVASCQPGPMR